MKKDLKQVWISKQTAWTAKAEASRQGMKLHEYIDMKITGEARESEKKAKHYYRLF